MCVHSVFWGWFLLRGASPQMRLCMWRPDLALNFGEVDSFLIAGGSCVCVDNDDWWEAQGILQVNTKNNVSA